jgi:hypothetical protein
MDGDSIRQALATTLGERVFVHTSDSDVLLSNSVKSGQVNHGLSGTLHERKLDMLVLFSRSLSRYAQDGWQRVANSPERRFRRTKGTSSGWIIGAPDSDNILANAIERNGTVSSFAVHLRPHRVNDPRTYYVPELTCEFRKTPQDWRLTCFLLKRVELDIPIESGEFKVPLKKGNVYFSQSANDLRPSGTMVIEPVDDITALKPSAVAASLAERASQGPPPRLSPLVYCTAFVFAVAACIWAYRAFCTSRPAN